MSPRRNARHDDGTADPLVALARADPLSPFYDPRYARPVSSTPPDGWGEIDTALLQERRAAVPAFPVDLLPTFWRDWVLDTSNVTGAPADYVAQSLLAAVAGLCGAGTVVRLGAALGRATGAVAGAGRPAIERQVAGDGADA
jgi:hypothetical protein